MMRVAHRRTLAAAISAACDGCMVFGRLVAVKPIEHVLRGFYIEDSTSVDRAYVWVFAQPLYRPAGSVVLTLGERLGGGRKTWAVEEAEMLRDVCKKDGLPFLARHGTPESLVEALAGRGSDGPQLAEMRALSLLMCGRHRDGARELRAVAEGMDTRVPWMAEARRRMIELAGLAESEPRRAEEAMLAWEAMTAEAIGITVG